MLSLWGTKLIFLSYTYSAASTKRWSSDIYTVHSWGPHTHTDTRVHTHTPHKHRYYTQILHTHKHTPKHVGVESNSGSRKQVYHNPEQKIRCQVSEENKDATTHQKWPPYKAAALDFSSVLRLKCYTFFLRG